MSQSADELHRGIKGFLGHGLILQWRRLNVLHQRRQTAEASPGGLKGLSNRVLYFLKKSLLPLPRFQERVSGKSLLSGEVVVDGGNDGTAVGSVLLPVPMVPLPMSQSMVTPRNSLS